MTSKKSTAGTDDAIIAYELDPPLKKLIGDNVKLADIFTEDRIKNCQKVLDDSRKGFFESITSSLEAAESAIGKLKSNISQQHEEELLSNIGDIRQQADALGFSLISQICDHITNLSAQTHTHQRQKDYFFLMEKLVHTLKIAFQQRIVDDGGATGKQLLASLEQLKLKWAQA